MLIRGRLFSLGHSSISNDVFVGKHVKVLEKKKLFIGHKSRLRDGIYIDALSDSWGRGIPWRQGRAW